MYKILGYINLALVVIITAPYWLRTLNKWTIKTKDRSLSAQWEHTVLVTPTGYEVLTVSPQMPPTPNWILAGAKKP